MILYHTWNNLWWLRWGGSPIIKWNAIFPALVCLFMVCVIQETDWVLEWEHPYAHQVFSISCTFLLTYRSQLAYQRFWEARSNMQMMSSRWCDAVSCFFIFEDQINIDKVKSRTKQCTCQPINDDEPSGAPAPGCCEHCRLESRVYRKRAAFLSSFVCRSHVPFGLEFADLITIYRSCREFELDIHRRAASAPDVDAALLRVPTPYAEGGARRPRGRRRGRGRHGYDRSAT
jgi:hypothetical protein